MSFNRTAFYRGKILLIVIFLNIIIVVLFEYFLQYGFVTIKFTECRFSEHDNSQPLYLLAKCFLQIDSDNTSTSEKDSNFTYDIVKQVEIINDTTFFPSPEYTKTSSTVSSKIISTTTRGKNSEKLFPESSEMPMNASYRYIMNNDSICPENGSTLNLIITVMTSIRNTHVREAIRDTWGGYAKKLGVPVLFFMGTSGSSFLQSLVEEENNQRLDIIQQDFVDNYFNLSVKTVMTLKWIIEYCAHVPYILKSDDDIFVNVDTVLEAIEKFNKSDAIHGLLAHKWEPIRSKRSKWFVSKQLFPRDEYPDFVAGPGYIISGKAIPKLYKAALRTPPIYLEDVYVTGIVAESANISRIHQPGMLNFRYNFDPCMYNQFLTSHSHPAWDIRKSWKTVHLPMFRCEHNETKNDERTTN